ncbi:glucose--fructose oxidoreductase [Abditibacteriota bacterium]|nr:glucose--fructose oxidoreductase [Abditibacteriota bacterium]
MNSPHSPIRWGVIGCGQIAVDKTIPGLLAARGAQLVALSDPLEVRRSLARNLTKNAGGEEVRAYASGSELVAAPDVDAVYIALPTGMHAEAVLEGARAKKAILCEKPLGRSAAEVAGMVRAAQEAGVPLMTGYMSRFSDVFQKGVHLLREEAIGQITFVSAHFSYPCLKYYPPGAPGGWRWTDSEGGGPLLDIGVYLAFGLREMLGDSIARIGVLNTDTIAPSEVAIPDTTAAWFQTRKGIPGTFVTTFSHYECRLAFYGSRGQLIIERPFNQTPGGRLELRTDDRHFVLDSQSDENLPHYDNYRREFEHFSRALLEKTPYHPSGLEVLTDALLLDALKDKSGSVVDIAGAEEFLQR